MPDLILTGTTRDCGALFHRERELLFAARRRVLEKAYLGVSS